MLAEKQAAAAALLEALAGGGAPPPLHARLLRDLAGENRRRLEHAIAVQGRIIGLIARRCAVPLRQRRAMAPPARWRWHGGAGHAVGAGITSSVMLR